MVKIVAVCSWLRCKNQIGWTVFTFELRFCSKAFGVVFGAFAQFLSCSPEHNILDTYSWYIVDKNVIVDVSFRCGVGIFSKDS